MTHKLIHTSDYLLVVDDSEIKEGEYCINLQDKGNNIFPFMDMRNIGIDYNKKVIKKIIAHLPLNNSPILEGVDLLPPLDNIRYDFAEMFYGLLKATYPTFDEWPEAIEYNKAKEKYRFTEEDMLRLLYWADSDERHIQNQRFEDFIQSLSQPKMPVGFECEMVTMNKGYTDEKDYPYQQCEINKTTTNSQGQTVWVGKYIY